MFFDAQTPYLAGFFDGEGWITMDYAEPYGRHKTPRYSLRVGVGNTNLKILKLFEKRWGGGIKIGNKINKQQWQWTIASSKAELPLIEMLPYLIEKYDQAMLALEYRATVSGKRGRTVPHEQLAYRESVRQKLRELKSVVME